MEDDGQLDETMRRTLETGPADPEIVALEQRLGEAQEAGAPAHAPDDPDAAGGDAFDLADLAVDRARYLRIKDTGRSKMGSDSQGFDLDAVVLINFEDR